MKQPRTTSAALIAAAALAAGSLTSAVLIAGEARGAQQGVGSAGTQSVPAQNPTASVDPCTLITEAEAAAALGVAVTAAPESTQCTYIAADSTARGVAVALPGVSANRTQLQAGAQQTATALGGSSRSIAAGDEAYAIISPMVSQGLGTASGKLVVVVLTNPQGTADEQASLLNGLLDQAFARL